MEKEKIFCSQRSLKTAAPKLILPGCQKATCPVAIVSIPFESIPCLEDPSSWEILLSFKIQSKWRPSVPPS